MQPVMTIPRRAYDELLEEVSDPYNLMPMTKAVDLPCGHSMDDSSLQIMRDNHEIKETPEAGNPGLVRVVHHITCAICRHPADHYVKAWALRGVAARLEALPSKAINEPASQPEPPPRAAPETRRRAEGFKDRFDRVLAHWGISLGGSIAGATLAIPTAAAFCWSEVTKSGWWWNRQIDTSNRDHNVQLAMLSSIITAVGISISVYLIMRNR